MFKKVLVPLDGTKPAEAILPYVSYLAKNLNIPAVLMTAVDSRLTEFVGPRYEIGDPATPQPAGKKAVPVNPELKASKYLEEMARRMRGAGLHAESEVIMGSNPAEEIVRAAERRQCNLITLSASSEHPAGQGILGGITTKLLYHSPIPIFIFRPPRSAPPTMPGSASAKLIVPLDGSSFGETALAYAEQLAQKLSAEIALVQAIQEPISFIPEPSLGITSIVPLQEVVVEKASEYLKHIAEVHKIEGVKSQMHVLKGGPAQSIAEFARSSPQSVIVMTSHGHSALARWLIGSVTETVVRIADNPVLIIPRQYGRRYAIEVTELLQRTPIFSKLTEQDLERIAQTAHIQSYQPSDIIIREGERGGGFFIMTAGKVEVLKGFETPNSSVLRTLGPGEFFGEMAIIDDQPRSATVRVVEPTECVTVRRSDFMAELERHPEIAVRILPELVRRLRESEDKTKT